VLVNRGASQLVVPVILTALATNGYFAVFNFDVTNYCSNWLRLSIVQRHRPPVEDAELSVWLFDHGKNVVVRGRADLDSVQRVAATDGFATECR